MADQRVINSVKISDPSVETQQAGVDSNNNLQVIINDELPAGSQNIGSVDIDSLPGVNVTGVAHITGTVDVNAVDLDVRDLDHTSDSVQVWANTQKDGAGTAYVPVVDPDGRLYVVIHSGFVGTEEVVPDSPIMVYGTTADLAAGATTYHSISDLLGTKYLTQFTAAASVPLKASLYSVVTGITGNTPVVTVFAQAGSQTTWTPPHRHYLSSLVSGGWALQITSLDNSEAADVYSNLAYQSN